MTTRLNCSVIYIGGTGGWSVSSSNASEGAHPPSCADGCCALRSRFRCFLLTHPPPGSIEPLVSSIGQASGYGNRSTLSTNHAKLVNAKLTTAMNKSCMEGAKDLNLDACRQAIDAAVDIEGFIDDRSAHDCARGIEDAIGSLEELLKDAHASEVVALAEHALRAVEDALQILRSPRFARRPANTTRRWNGPNEAFERSRNIPTGGCESSLRMSTTAGSAVMRRWGLLGPCSMNLPPFNTSKT